MKTVSTNTIQENIPEILPVIPTMDVVVFPHMIVPLLILDERIIQGVHQAVKEAKKVMLIAAKKQVENYDGAIGTKDLYGIGTVATIMRIIKVPEGGVKILVQGLCRAAVKDIIVNDGSLNASIELFNEEVTSIDSETLAQIKNIKELAERINTTTHSFSPDFHIILSKMHEPQKIADFVLSHLNLSVEDAQALLEKKTNKDFLAGIYYFLEREIEVVEVQERIKNNTREAMNKSQKEFYLREQLKAIKKELGEDDSADIETMREKLDKLFISQEVYKEIDRQINRLDRMSSDSMEAAVTRNYLDWILSLPWGKETEDNLDIKNAKKILDEDHYGLEDIKDKILDYISVKNLKKDGYTPILCFFGPPGTGKTSLGKSIAKCLGREYARVSLGGVKDEAEIRGHRRTYVGAMPGRFVQAFRKVDSCNPVILIDELDKIGQDYRGDPAAAMLEVLDPQQNKNFYDNYLSVPFDLSKVIFIATANTIDTISEPLRDRMDIIQLSGYTHDEKLAIAKMHLVKRALSDCGLSEEQVIVRDEVLLEIIENYTREAGVRQFERLIRKLCCKIVRCLVETDQLIEINNTNIETYLGPRKFIEDDNQQEHLIGITNGVAWTAYGGEMIKIEAVIMQGKGKLILTGQLGNVMKESAQAAVSYIRANAKEFGISPKMFSNYDLHIHVPAGAVPKDGPSAGITMLSSILSALLQKPINADYAMTGELNLRGDVMPIGGVKEKILAAKRNKIPYIILPFKNKKDLHGIKAELLKDIDIIWVNHADEVLQQVIMGLDKKAQMR